MAEVSVTGGNDMALKLNEKISLTKEVSKRYNKLRKKVKRLILDEFVQVTGYNRAYASYILKNCEKIGSGNKKSKRKRKKIYDDKIFNIVKYLWTLSGFLCGKRLVFYIREVLPILIREQEIEIDINNEEKVIQISAATIDRLLCEEKKRYALKSRARTKPGSLLKHQIPIRTFADWDEQQTGFVEIDLVSHDGGNLKGDFIQTLNVTDVKTGWTEMEAVKNKAQIWVFNALKNKS